MNDKTKRFAYRNLDQLKQAIDQLGFDLPTTNDCGILAEGVSFGRLTVPNRFVAQPMEGCDATVEGHPTELTTRKYRRFAAGGIGMLWWEACATVPEGKANPHQLSLTPQTASAWEDMLRQVHEAAAAAGQKRPICVLQMTHSGRYSRPVAGAEPIIAHRSPILDPKHNLPADYPLVTDEYLEDLQQRFVEMATLAAQVGFDAVDIKSCHRYLISELLASFTREDSRYGGSYENRTRLLRETARKVIDAVGDRVEVTARLNAYDAIEYPYGWGVSAGDVLTPDLAEPIRLIGELKDLGFAGINITIGNPYFNPHVNRPADWMIAHWPEKPEHPLLGVNRIVQVVREIQQAHPGFPVIGSGYSWLRQYTPAFAAAAVQNGWASLIGLGRGSLAYPDFPRDLFETGRMDRHKVCVACSSCTQMMRDGQISGCLIRDAETYGPIYKEGRHRDPQLVRDLAGRCRVCADPMCRANCPAGVDIPAFLSALAEGRDREAYDILRAGNCLPGICGAVCPAEEQCQAGCIQRLISDRPVEIGEVQKQLSRRAVREGWAAIDVPAEASGKRVAVIGAGPAGLAAAIELLKRGHAVSLLDRTPRAGGKLGAIIPATRLADATAQQEIDAIFASVPPERLNWRLGEPLADDRTLDDILAEGFDAAVVALGLGNGSQMPNAQRAEGVMDANAFLRHMNANPDHTVPARVAVLGGGNTAMDAATLAARRGASDVYVVYRRSFSQMPAWPAERDEALHQGVHFMVLCQPTGYQVDDQGRLTGVNVVRTELGPADASGRRRPEPVEDTRFAIGADMAIEAIGEGVDPAISDALPGVQLTAKGLLAVDDSLRTSRPNVWAAGDVVNGGTTVVQAVAEGRLVAEAIDRSFRGVATTARG